jgi:hypothetical protein
VLGVLDGQRVEGEYLPQDAVVVLGRLVQGEPEELAAVEVGLDSRAVRPRLRCPFAVEKVRAHNPVTRMPLFVL